MRSAIPATTLPTSGSPVARLGRVVEYNSDGVSHAGADAAHTVAEADAVVSLRALHWPIVNRERHGIILGEVVRPRRGSAYAAVAR